MSINLADAIAQLTQERKLSSDLVRKTIEEILLTAYKQKYHTDENAIVRFSDNDTKVNLYAQRRIVEQVEDEVLEIDLSHALRIHNNAEIGDEILVEIDTTEFDRGTIQNAKQRVRQKLREIQKDTIYSEFKDKVNELIIGYYQRERGGNIYCDLGKIEGILPKRFQSPREVYRDNDRIKALIHEVKKSTAGLQVILSRTHPEFVRRIFELEVPEIYDRTIEIYKIVREPGYRTKIAILTTREDVDPLGACVGLRGVRIQSIVRELEGEKVDVIKFDNDPMKYISNALSPANILSVRILDAEKRHAVAIVNDNQLSLAIGKQGLNVRLANRLTDWNIEVKTQQQASEMQIASPATDTIANLFAENHRDEEEEVSLISELSDISHNVIIKLKDNGIELIEDLLTHLEDGFTELSFLLDGEKQHLKTVLTEVLEIVENEE